MVKKEQSEFVDMLMKNEWKQTDAEAKVAQITAAIKKNSPDANQEFVDATLRSALSTLIRSKIEQINGVCIGFGTKQDANGFAKRKAQEVYAQDSVRAAREKFVVTDKDGKIVFETDDKGSMVRDKQGNPIPLAADNREFVDPDTKKKKNSRWGKPLGTTIQRDAFFILPVEGKNRFVRVFGDFDVKMGYKYTLAGTLAKPPKMYMSIPKTGPGVKELGMIDDVDYWKLFNETAQTDEMAVVLGDTVDILKNKNIVTKGFVSTVRNLGDRIMVVINDDSYPEGMVCFTASDSGINVEAETLGAGNEIVLVGRISESADKTTGELRRNINLFGFASNPESDKIVSAVRDLDSVLYT